MSLLAGRNHRIAFIHSVASLCRLDKPRYKGFLQQAFNCFVTVYPECVFRTNLLVILCDRAVKGKLTASAHRAAASLLTSISRQAMFTVLQVRVKKLVRPATEQM